MGHVSEIMILIRGKFYRLFVFRPENDLTNASFAIVDLSKRANSQLMKKLTLKLSNRYCFVMCFLIYKCLQFELINIKTYKYI